ncbi:MAG TPA: carbamoyl-phosphate synthase domain-containing protein, partial [Actinomycetota bacterium]|nr:carbamoyl-phosphate synthase domain-containing protein [Actinomycetota bacterium]
MTAAPATLLALEDGTVFRGSGFGAGGESFGEAVFNTGMGGYQEVLSDPSYAGQIVTMTAPQQGNYGMHGGEEESGTIHVAGFAVREASRRAFGPGTDGTLGEALASAGVVGIEGIDTRKLTRRIRDAGAMRAAISTTDLEPSSLVARVRETQGM